MKQGIFQLTKPILTYVLLIASIGVLHAQEDTTAQVKPIRLVYDVDFLFDFDNREVHNPYEESGTIFGLRLTPTIGMEVNDAIGGIHRLAGGVSYIQPFGADWRETKVYPTIFYRYKTSRLGSNETKGAKGEFRMSLGFVPYNELFEALPDYLRSDSLAFAYPNIQGALFQYRSQWGHVEALADWRGMMSSTVREAFRLVAGGKFRYQWLYVGGYAQMNHLSHSTKEWGVVDDVVVNPLVGVDLTRITPLDSLALQTGYLMGWQRDRRYEMNEVAHGLHVDFLLRWRWIGVRNEFYFGDNQMPYYQHYGTLSNQGDPRYQARLFNRTDLYLYLVRRSFVTCYFGWNFLYLADYGLSHQQQLVCRFNLEECLRYNKLGSDAKRASRKKGDLLKTMTYR